MITRRELLKGMGAAVSFAVLPPIKDDYLLGKWTVPNEAGNVWITPEEAGKVALGHLEDALRYIVANPEWAIEQIEARNEYT